ncbi:MAG TPA: calcium-binding protein [Solirubrobacterales bacterium]|nr:calcium-binding protein [Solirubrobacterales bacterium]
MRRLALGAICAAIVLIAVSPARHAAGAGGSAPSCAEGPRRVGGTIVGTPCDDTIVVPPGVAEAKGGGGDDTIVAAPIAAADSCPEGCRLGIGSQTFEGGPGNDVVYGERGNDRLFGGEGDDQLFGGIGDDLLEGGPGDDRLSGGFGADSIDGEGGSDYVRGDGTLDRIFDTGSSGNDTLSYSTGVTPGFFDNHSFDPTASKGLPPLNGERGVYLDLAGTVGDNGVAPFGGGVDEVEAGAFETVIGTPFSDYIVGSEAGETIYGGGGADAILGRGGNDTLRGGADGDHLDGGTGNNDIDGGPGSDHCEGAATETSCESATNKGGVIVRDPSKIVAGLMAPEYGGGAQLYLAGSDATDKVTASYSPGPPASVTFQLGAGSAPFDTAASAAGGCEPPSGNAVICPLAKPLDSIVLAGLGGDDTMTASGFPASVGVILAGGEGSDSLTGGEESEDVLADGPDLSGPGNDTLTALGRDDALLNNGGADHLFGGSGNDLFLSDSICDGDVLDGGAGSERDNASWAKFGSGIEARIEPGDAGEPGADGAPECPGGTLDKLEGIEDLEGTTSGDVLYGGSGPNQLLGWEGSDKYFAGAGSDVILANSGDYDPTIDCGADVDRALIDHPVLEPHDVAAADCEEVQEADRNSFRFETLPPPPKPAAEPPSEPSPAGGGAHKPVPHPRPPSPCLAGGKPGVLRCAVRPRNLGFGGLGRVNGIRWLHWGSRRATGFGRLTITAGCCGGDVVAARVRAGGLKSCNSRRWYTRLSVAYGRGYRKSLLRRALGATPCG